MLFLNVYTHNIVLKCYFHSLNTMVIDIIGPHVHFVCKGRRSTVNEKNTFWYFCNCTTKYSSDHTNITVWQLCTYSLQHNPRGPTDRHTVVSLTSLWHIHDHRTWSPEKLKTKVEKWIRITSTIYQNIMLSKLRKWIFPWWYTVYPKKYAHGFCFAVLCCGYTLTDFPISIRLTSLALWQSNDCPSASKATLMNMDKYFMWIHYERFHNHNKAKHNKTVCIFLGIYCTSHSLDNLPRYNISGLNCYQCYHGNKPS